MGTESLQGFAIVIVQNPPEPHTIMPRGAFIVIEGLDRAGKTTQTELLAEHLATTTGLSVSRRKFPGEQQKTTHKRQTPTNPTLSYPQCSPCQPTDLPLFPFYSLSLSPRSHDGHRQADQRVPQRVVRPRRPRDPPSLLREPMGSRARARGRARGRDHRALRPVRILRRRVLRRQGAPARVVPRA